MVHTLILVRHGESTWNRDNRFTGWTDVDLSPKGVEEAHQAARRLHEAGLSFDVVYTSVLKRAIRTAWIMMDDLDRMFVPVIRSWRLNERHYGALQGLNKTEMAKKYGKEKVHEWRRSYDICPPSLETSDTRHPIHDPRYSKVDRRSLPATESLKDTLERVTPFWNDAIVPDILSGNTVMIAAHGNSLRALVKFLDQVSDSKIVEFEIPTGMPLVYELDDNLVPVQHYSLEGEIS